MPVRTPVAGQNSSTGWLVTPADLAAQWEYGHHGKSPDPEEDQR